MFLDDRKSRILEAIISDYVETAEPVGSRTIARKHQLGFSSATIRNEMADLEEMGYLAQPHTSAGRVPSDKGYRYYVDQLMKIRHLTEKESRIIREAMEERINELSQLLKLASNVMSRFTKYTSLAIAPQIKKSTLKAVQVVPIESNKVLVLIVTSAGVVKNSTVKLQSALLPDVVARISNFLNEKLNGRIIETLASSISSEVEKEIGVENAIIAPVLEGINDCIHQIESSEVYLEGTTNILNFPEFSDISKAKELLDIMDKKEVLLKLFRSSGGKYGINVQIGEENELEKIKDCSLVTATYSMGNVVIGSIGVIGPKRMEYERVISSLNFIRKRINQEINVLLGESE
ncbi:MAG: heat-inducible transcriptional repressor HrcA [Acetivibrionales bacterium]